MNNQKPHIASLSILYSETPKKTGDVFVEIRQWETFDSEQQELIVEYGRLLDDGDLQTQTQVVPFYQTIKEVLADIR